MTDSGRRIVVFGDVFDDVVAVSASPVRADTDTLASIRFRPGGSAANTAAWLGSQGADVDFVGRVAASDHARHTKLLSESGVRPHLNADADLPTGTIVLVVDGQSRTMLTERGANAAFDPDDVTNELLTGAALVHFTGYSVFGRLASARRLVARAGALGVNVSVDPGSAGFLADVGGARFVEAVAGATLFFPNLDEGKALTGLDIPKAIALDLGRSFRTVALTLGLEGAIVVDAGRAEDVPATPADVLDPTGAGDAFNAGFLHAWVGGAGAAIAAHAGAELASRAVTVMGGRPESSH